MDEAESKESVHEAEQTESRSIKAEEEEATPKRGHLGDLSAGKSCVRRLTLTFRSMALFWKR